MELAKMGRPFGAIDSRPRKPRKDRGKKRKLYAGKPPKYKKYIKTRKRQENTGIMKLWIWEKVPMSKEGRRRWNKYVRHFANPYVFPADRKLRLDVHISQINTKEKMEQLVAFHMSAGTYYVMGFSHGKNQFHIKPVKLCEIVVRETEQGNVGVMISNDRLGRYWFWQK